MFCFADNENEDANGDESEKGQCDAHGDDPVRVWTTRRVLNLHRCGELQTFQYEITRLILLVLLNRVRLMDLANI